MKRVKKDERGSSLVLTIIAMTFISLLALAVISMTITNIRLKQAQKRSQTNFYNADSIVDAIRAGVEDLSSDAARDAYAAAFSAYSSVLSGSSKSLSDHYGSQFLQSMIHELSDGSEDMSDGVTVYHYKDEVLRGYLSAVQADGYQSHTGGQGEMLLQENTLLLKDIVVAKTQNSYQTKINTDIRIEIPAMTSETHSEYLNYALIADNQIKADVGGTASIEGDIYSGTVRRKESSAVDPEAGILVDHGTTLNINAENVISRGDILIRDASGMAISGKGSETANVWVENIQTKSSGGSGDNKLTIDGDCNVADDMELWGEGDSVKLSGNYYGYNYNEKYDGVNLTSVSQQSDFSSAILINGRKCTLNLEGLSRLVLSGRTFISKKSSGEFYDGTTTPIENKDIQMGESLSVKGSQLAYYVPVDFITKGDAESGYVYPYRNGGVLYFQYDTEPDKAYAFDYEAYNDYLGVAGFNILDYVSTTTPLVYYYRNDLSVSNKPVSYYYLNFENEILAGQFYSVFTASSPNYSTIEDVNKAFMTDAGITINNGDAILCRSGNVLYKNPDSGRTELKLANEAVVPDSLLTEYAKVKTKEYMSRQLALVEDYDEASSSNQWRLSADNTELLTKSGKSDLTSEQTNLFYKLVDQSALTDTEAKVAEGGVKITTSSYTWNSSEKGKFGNPKAMIIVAKGDVTLETDFSGMIIAGGDIQFNASGIKVTANSEVVEKMFTEDKNAASPLFYDMFSKYFRKTVDSTIGKDKADKKKNIYYENWTKE